MRLGVRIPQRAPCHISSHGGRKLGLQVAMVARGVAVVGVPAGVLVDLGKWAPAGAAVHRASQRLRVFRCCGCSRQKGIRASGLTESTGKSSCDHPRPEDQSARSGPKEPGWWCGESPGAKCQGTRARVQAHTQALEAQGHPLLWWCRPEAAKAAAGKSRLPKTRIPSPKI